MQVAESMFSASLQVARGGSQPARRRRRGSAKYGRRVRWFWQKDSSTFLVYKDQITNHPQPSTPLPKASSNKRTATKKQLNMTIGAERREKKKAIAGEARERAKREKACVVNIKQRSKVKELRSTLSVAYRQVREYTKKNAVKEKELATKLSEQEMLNETAMEKRIKVCQS